MKAAIKKKMKRADFFVPMENLRILGGSLWSHAHYFPECHEAAGNFRAGRVDACDVDFFKQVNDTLGHQSGVWCCARSPTDISAAQEYAKPERSFGDNIPS